MILSDLRARIASGDAISAEAAGELLACYDIAIATLERLASSLEALADDVPGRPYRHPVHREMVP